MSFFGRKPPDAELVPWYEFRAMDGDDETTAVLHIFGEIGGGFFFDEEAITGKSIQAQLDALPASVTTIRVLVNSLGGSVFDGQHIANALRRQREEKGRAVVVEIEAVAASAATLITSAGGTIRMPRNAMLMIHNPWAFAIGDSAEMAKVSEILDKLKAGIVAAYQLVSHLSAATLHSMMDAETWMDADEALENGFITEISEPVAAQASASADVLARLSVPERFAGRFAAALEGPAPAANADLTTTEPPAAPARETATDDPEQDAAASVEPKGTKTMTPEEKAAKAAADKQAAVAAKQATLDERARIDAIESRAKAARHAGIDGKTVADLEATAKADGTSAEAFGETILNMLADAPANTDGPGNIPAGGSIVPGEDEHDKRRESMAAAMLQRAAGAAGVIARAAEKSPKNPTFQGVTDPRAAGDFRGMSLLDFARASLEESRPGSTKGRNRMEIAGDFLASAGGSQSTSDFPVAFENLLHKTLLAAFDLAPDTWRRFCAVGSVSDFRSHNRHRSGEFASLDQIFEGGEFTHRAIPDTAKETIAALTYGNKVKLTRQAIVNDDMSVFDRLAVQLGLAAAETIESAVYALLAQNSNLGPTMNDAVAMFDAAHNNLGAGAALTIAAIDADRVVMAAQTDVSGNRTADIRPSVLVVPAGLGGLAKSINRSTTDITSGAVAGSPNIVAGLFDDIVDTGRLTGTRRYMFADPNLYPTIEVAFLEGEQLPYMEMQDDWNSDAVEWKVRHDFGASGVGFRGALTDAGA